MAILKIYKDSRGYGNCRSCGQEIEWAELVASGRKMPFDGPIVAVQTEGDATKGERIVEHVDSTVTKSHFASCIDAGEWRKKRR